MSSENDEALGRLAVKEGYLTEGHLREAFRIRDSKRSGDNGASLAQVLMENGFLKRAEVDRLLQTLHRDRPASQPARPPSEKPAGKSSDRPGTRRLAAAPTDRRAATERRAGTSARTRPASKKLSLGMLCLLGGFCLAAVGLVALVGVLLAREEPVRVGETAQEPEPEKGKEPPKESPAPANPPKEDPQDPDGSPDQPRDGDPGGRPGEDPYDQPDELPADPTPDRDPDPHPDPDPGPDPGGTRDPDPEPPPERVPTQAELMGRIQVALFAKDYVSAKTAMEDYIRFYPDDPMSGQWRMFIPNLDDPRFQKQLEQMLDQAQKDPQAALEQAFAAAQMAEMQGNVDLAKTGYRQIVQMAPGSETAKKAQARLDALGDN